MMAFARSLAILILMGSHAFAAESSTFVGEYQLKLADSSNAKQRLCTLQLVISEDTLGVTVKGLYITRYDDYRQQYQVYAPLGKLKYPGSLYSVGEIQGNVLQMQTYKERFMWWDDLVGEMTLTLSDEAADTKLLTFVETDADGNNEYNCVYKKK